MATPSTSTMWEASTARSLRAARPRARALWSPLASPSTSTTSSTSSWATSPARPSTSTSRSPRITASRSSTAKTPCSPSPSTTSKRRSSPTSPTSGSNRPSRASTAGRPSPRWTRKSGTACSTSTPPTTCAATFWRTPRSARFRPRLWTSRPRSLCISTSITPTCMEPTSQASSKCPLALRPPTSSWRKTRRA